MAVRTQLKHMQLKWPKHYRLRKWFEVTCLRILSAFTNKTVTSRKRLTLITYVFDCLRFSGHPINTKTNLVLAYLALFITMTWSIFLPTVCIMWEFSLVHIVIRPTNVYSFKVHKLYSCLVIFTSLQLSCLHPVCHSCATFPLMIFHNFFFFKP